MKRLHALCTSLCLIVILTSTPAFAIIAIHIEGQTQGTIDGDLTLPGEEGNIGAMGFSSSVDTPTDPASGQPTGRRQYSPIMISKSFDVASVRMNQAFLTNERLAQVLLHFYTTGGQGQDIHYYSAELVDASIVSYDQSTEVGIARSLSSGASSSGGSGGLMKSTTSKPRTIGPT